MNPKIQIAHSEAEWVHLATETITYQANQAINERGFFSLVLSGGSTPAPVYQSLAADQTQTEIDWERWYIFWGDERCVPPNHPESNYKMASEALLEHVPIPKDNIVRIKGELDPKASARIYEQEIEKFFAGKEMRFDTVLLGVGSDGHTASLFPGQKTQAQKHWVIPAPHPTSSVMRISLTFQAINTSRNIIFLVKGREKSMIVAEAIQNQENEPNYPVKYILGKEKPPEWIIDEAASEKLKFST